MNVSDLKRLTQVRALLATGEAKRRRVISGLSLSEIAGACLVDPSTVWRWEEGLRSPRGRDALRYWRVLDRLAPPTERTS